MPRLSDEMPPVKNAAPGLPGSIVSRDGGVTWQPRSFPYTAGNADMTYNVVYTNSGTDALTAAVAERDKNIAF